MVSSFSADPACSRTSCRETLSPVSEAHRASHCPLGDHATTGVPYKQGFDEFSGYLHQVHAQEIPDRYLYWEKQPQNRGGLRPWSVAIRKGDWKAVRNTPQLPLELYDLSSDAGEQHNVATQHPDVVRQIEEYLQTGRTVSREYPPEEPSWGYRPLDTGYVR
jgi:hypothetical protein